MFALEGDVATLPALTHLRFGTPRNWVYKDASGNMTCTSAYFGADPNPGVFKQCQTTALSEATRNVKIMPIGDSITGFYRDYLWNSIQTAGYRSVDFVGNSPYTYYTRTDPDADYNGYGGYGARYLLKPAGTGTATPSYFGDERDLPIWLEGQAPDIVLLHLGTNDFINSGEVLAGISKILAGTRQRNPAVKFFVAQIIPAVGNRAWDDELNTAIARWAPSVSTAASPVVVVDQYTGFDATTMTTDGTHPNAIGGRLMGDRWFNAIRAHLR
jgi:lysophospholipase L1-like esterase